MSSRCRLDAAFQNALCLPLDENSRYIIFSDCHRGVGNRNDNFVLNEPLYLAAMEYYFERNYTYLELGDGDELWENRSIAEIKEMHRQSFGAMEEFYGENRMYAVYGNHDMIKKRSSFTEKYVDKYFCEKGLCEQSLCPGIRFYSGIVLRDEEIGREVYLTHGHQADLLNSTLWVLARFLVRYVWKPLEAIGIPDPTSAAKNNTRKKKTERALTDWVQRREKILITGHTHRPSAGSPQVPCFNTGSCIHPGGITGIEIQNRCITLVKWAMRADRDMRLSVVREVLGTPVPLVECRAKMEI